MAPIGSPVAVGGAPASLKDYGAALHLGVSRHCCQYDALWCQLGCEISAVLVEREGNFVMSLKRAGLMCVVRRRWDGESIVLECC